MACLVKVGQGSAGECRGGCRRGGCRKGGCGGGCREGGKRMPAPQRGGGAGPSAAALCLPTPGLGAAARSGALCRPSRASPPATTPPPAAEPTPPRPAQLPLPCRLPPAPRLQTLSPVQGSLHAALHGRAWGGEVIACVVTGGCGAAASGAGGAGGEGRLAFAFRSDSAEVVAHIQVRKWASLRGWGLVAQFHLPSLTQSNALTSSIGWSVPGPACFARLPPRPAGRACPGGELAAGPAWPLPG